MIKNKFNLTAFAIIVVMLFSSCAKLFQDKINMYDNEKATSTITDIFAQDEVIDKLRAPTRVYVSQYDYNDTIKISWSSVPYAASYCLERAVVTQKNIKGGFDVPDENDYEIIEHAATLSTTTFEDKIINDLPGDLLNYENPKYGYGYFYRVKAQNKRAGYESSDYTVSTSAATLLAPPNNCRASMGDNEDYVTLSWNETRGAISYEIYRTVNSDGSNAVKIANANRGRPRYQDDTASAYPGQELYYIIYAISSNSGKSVASSPAMGYTLLKGAPPKVSNVRIEKGRGNVSAGDGITVKWDKIDKDDINYAVYRSSSSDSVLTKLKEGPAANFTNEEWTDKKALKPNTYYYYYVQAYTTDDDATLKGPMSDSGADSEAPAEGFIVSPPTSLTVSKDEESSDYCMVYFTAAIGDQYYAADSGIYKSYTITDEDYVVLGSSTESGEFLEITERSTVDYENGYYSIRVPAREFYKMRTVKDGATSTTTAIAAPAPYAAQNVYVTRAAAIPGYTDDMVKSGDKVISEPQANKNGVHAVKITWEPPEGGAEGYRIYRSAKPNIFGSTSPDTGYKCLNPDKPLTTCVYYDAHDDDVKAGTIYYYRVLSLNSLGQGANYSIVDRPTLIDIINTKGANVNQKWPNPKKPAYAGKAKIIDITKGRGFGWGALTIWQYMQEQRKTVVTSQAKLTLMHKSNNLDKLGSETIYGDICGSLEYKSTVSGVNGVVTMPYTDYADLFVQSNPDLGVYFFFDNGNTNTDANMSANGKMNGYITHFGMYPGWVRYDKVEIKGGKAAGGTYGVIRKGIEAENGDDKSKLVEVDWQAGN